ncbi:dipicolinate synthase subunit B [Phocea massiliensis]|uniref:Dipicolinate synthase subunit B n=1 Tax=Merdimmobilis hominis TaxID=2897707 RepID=A0A938X8J6_9FIRM|nr:dipicolinate synthase subunit B [Merdimmobilis hominis]MBM6921090.1 dipicolinate synthase subunit B [Merdimmobilis hominis]
MARCKLGFAITGSFCTIRQNLDLMRALSADYDILPIFSYHAASLDTRFGKAADFIKEAEEIAGKKAICTIPEAEPIGPKHLTDLMLVSPCTGNTLAKLALSITDTPVTMAVKSHLRGKKPVVIAVSTNDAIAGSAKNIGVLTNLKHYFFVPLRQDDYEKKPASLVADFSRVNETLSAASKHMQVEPLFLPPL